MCQQQRKQFKIMQTWNHYNYPLTMNIFLLEIKMA
nr:MAG TPA: hypothetical protein [Caudoviricetes sp.]